MAHYSRRDLIGHYVRKTQQTRQMCGHACCRNRRVHPANMPVVLPNRLLRRASEDDLQTHYRRVSKSDTDQAIEAQYQILAEMDRRDQADIRRHQSETRRRERILGQKMARAEAIDTAWMAAEADTNGNMLNKAGRAAGVSDRSLFTGPESVARRYASEELLNHWQHNPRPTRAMFDGKDTRITGQGSSARARSAARSRARRAPALTPRTFKTGTGKTARTITVATVRRAA